MALDDVDWSPFFSSSNVNKSLSCFLHKFNSISNKGNPLFLNKYKLYGNKVTFINKFYHTSYYTQVLLDSDNAKKMWDNKFYY